MLWRRHTFFPPRLSYIIQHTHTYTHIHSLFGVDCPRGVGVGWRMGEGEQNMELSQPVA